MLYQYEAARWSILHGEGVSKLVTAKSMKAEAVIKAAENIIWKNRGQVLEWLRAGRLQKATPTLLLLVLPEESVTSIYGKNDERRRELVRCAAKLLPPLPELQEKMEAVTFRAVEKVAVNRGEDDALKRALNRLYDEAVAQGILQENNVKKLLVTMRSEGEKADKKY